MVLVAFCCPLIVAGSACLALGDTALSTVQSQAKLSCQHATHGWRLKLATHPRCRTSGGRLHPAATFTLEGEIRLSAIDFFVRLVPNDHEVIDSLDPQQKNSTQPEARR
jgi:hypothetical protein